MPLPPTSSRSSPSSRCWTPMVLIWTHGARPVTCAAGRVSAAAAVRHPERVVALRMRASNLSGRISPSLGNLSFLRELDRPPGQPARRRDTPPSSAVSAGCSS